LRKIRWSYLPWQSELRKQMIREQTKLCVLCCGARSGKDVFARQFVAEMALRIADERAREGIVLNPMVNIWVVAPRRAMYSDLRHGFYQLLPSDYQRYDSKLDILHWPGDIQIKFKSTAEPENLVAEGVDFLIYTECTRDQRGYVAWHESLTPRLKSPGRYGLAILTGTPRNYIEDRDNWVKKLFFDIREGRVQGVALNLPTSCNPLMAGAIKDLQNIMPRRMFLSEIMAQWLDDEDSRPFPLSQITQAVGAPHGKRASRHVIAIDPARYHDATAIVVGYKDDSGKIVLCDCEEIVGADLATQMSRITKLAKTYSADIIIDRTGIGTFMYDELQRLFRGRRVDGISFTHDTKMSMTNLLASRFESAAISLDLPPEKATALIESLANFGMEIDDRGKVRVGGEKDDLACAAMLACVRLSSEVERNVARGGISLRDFFRF